MRTYRGATMQSPPTPTPQSPHPPSHSSDGRGTEGSHVRAGRFSNAVAMSMRKAALLPTLVLGLAGCAGLSASPSSPISDRPAALHALEAVYSPAKIVTCISTPVESQRPCRDEIAQALIVAIDMQYADYELGFFDANRYGTFGATVATLGLTGAASVSAGAAARLLSAIAAGVTGTREAFNRDVLIDHTAVALQSAMRAKRDTVLAQIRNGLRSPPSEYPIGAALSDLNAYYRAGTIVGALAGLNESVATDAKTARANLGLISAVAVTPSALDLMRQFRATPVANRAAFIRRIETIMRGLGMPGTGMELIFDPLREADRQIVARQLTRQ